MDRRTTGMIATIASVLLCGLPGLCLCIFSAVGAAGVLPYSTEFNGVTNNGVMPASYGWAGLCLALLLIAIPIVVGFLTLRNRPAVVAAPVPPPGPVNPPDEPLPPAS